MCRGTSINETPSEFFSLCGPERTTLIAISCGFTGPVHVETWHGRQIGSMPTLPGAMDARVAILDWIAAFVEQRRQDGPRGDVVDGVLAAEIEGRPISQQETMAILQLLLFGGLDTTAGALGQMMMRFCREPAIPALLRERPELLPDAIEELFRLLARQYEYILVDAGSQINACSIAALYTADQMFLIANPDVPSVRNAQRLLDRVRQLGACGERVRFLLNRAAEPFPLLGVGAGQYEVVGERAYPAKLGDRELAALGRMRDRGGMRLPAFGGDRRRGCRECRADKLEVARGAFALAELV